MRESDTRISPSQCLRGENKESHTTEGTLKLLSYAVRNVPRGQQALNFHFADAGRFGQFADTAPLLHVLP